MRIKYYMGVHVPAGWRQVSVLADAEQISAGMAKVINVVQIDGETPGYGQSRTGAKRQEFNGHYWAREEVGKRKRLSACEVITSNERIGS
jgi:hypothetical protein